MEIKSSIAVETGAARRVAIVTGASRGIGAGVARQLLSDRWRVAVAARTPSGLRDLCAEAAPGEVLAVMGDLRDVPFAEHLRRKPWTASVGSMP